MDAYGLGRSWLRWITQSGVYRMLMSTVPDMPSDSALRLTHWILDMQADAETEMARDIKRKQIKLRRARR
jgi:hypothetical protein